MQSESKINRLSTLQKNLNSNKHNVEALATYIDSNNIKIINLRFTDMLGRFRNKQISFNSAKSALQFGVGVDGSSLPGFQSICNSDLKIKPDISQIHVDGFSSLSSLDVLCCITNPDNTPYHSDPRTIAQKAEKYLKSLDFIVPDPKNLTMYAGPEPEFYYFDDAKISSRQRSLGVELISSVFPQDVTSKGYNCATKDGYYVSAPLDKYSNLRSTTMMMLSSLSIPTEAAHTEVGSSQQEIQMVYSSLTKMADQITMAKYIIRQNAIANGKTATFMPKPIFGEAGSGMHVHCSLFDGKKNLMIGDSACGLSQLGLYFIGGILKHGKALCAFTNPTTNSYKRLIDGYEAPTRFCYSSNNRSAAIRIPSTSKKSRRIEYRVPDGTSNPYLCFSAILMAGLDGIKNKIDPGKPVIENIFHSKQAEFLPATPYSLKDALDALEKDHAFLLEGNVFDKPFIKSYSGLLRDHVSIVNQTPSAVEFALYFSF